MLSFWCPVMMVTKNLDDFRKKMDFGPKNCIFGPKFCIFLRYTHITPIFWGQTNPTQWDHKSPISWGNSGYLWFSGRWPFGRSAGRFSAPIAQSGPFWAQKCCFRPEINFLCTSSNVFFTIMTGHQKDNILGKWNCIVLNVIAMFMAKCTLMPI